ncbi:putative polypeptide N-acetylgalactosaminyltransferase 9 [Zeugodacus cucurbitae]|uniref:putative polypeptide N-acetylgalactosaminyltransferase 9 n=1 Tax=Zeugodacus cucurbitae TaxID=28588 RepID=UPI0023D94405|nr:putative polypeptide N-acetylgalactosaminyltransferase 9 [Zeugodacus cucurbitae]
MLRNIARLLRVRHPRSVVKLLLIIAVYTFINFCKWLHEPALDMSMPTEMPLNSQPTDVEVNELLPTEFELLSEKDVIDNWVIDENTIPQIFKAMEEKSALRHTTSEINGPGELGKPVNLPENLTDDMKKAVNQGWDNNKFNQYVSDMISLQRTLPDQRDDWCKKTDHYLQNLPKTDVIICFYNEAWSTLLRTVHSVLNRSPQKLIQNIILVDDFSDMAHTKEQLDQYFERYIKVRIIRATKREGLIRARLLGARYATAPILTFLDSHCECGEGWLEPLLDRIARNNTTVVYPNIAIIDPVTFEYFNYGDTLIGGFDWSLTFIWIPTPRRESERRNHTMEPVYSPTMPGGLFSISREFFEQLGTYDAGFLIWGAENLELSFKTWMCGGKLEMIPCSHVGHIFRKTSPYASKGVQHRNSVRLAEVWMDNYAKYFYHNINYDKGDYGNVKSRIALRKRLNCQSFKWYLQNVYPELEIPKDPLSAGEIRNLGVGGNKCLDVNGRVMSGLPVAVQTCHGNEGNQHWFLTTAGEIRHGNFCLDYPGSFLIIYRCHGEKGNQYWSYDTLNRFLRQVTSTLCLAVSTNGEDLLMDTCDPDNMYQKWLLEKFDKPI